MIYPNNFEQKIGFDQIRHILGGRCLSTLGKDKVEAAVESVKQEEARLQATRQKKHQYTR